MRDALYTLLADAAAHTEDGYSVALAALNVLQTVALAYLAASRHRERNGS